MVASAELKLDIKPLEAMQKGIDDVETLVFDVAQETSDRVSKEHLPRLREYPPRLAVLPFQFATEKSRRWYFANKVPKGGGGGRYQRTGGLAQSIRVKTLRGNGIFTSELSSSMNALQFVVGNLNKQRQVPGHKNTGWEFIAPKIEAWQSDMLSTFFRLYSERIGNLSEVSIR